MLAKQTETTMSSRRLSLVWPVVGLVTVGLVTTGGFRLPSAAFGARL